MKVVLKWKFLWCLLLCLGIGLLPAAQVGAVDVSDPVMDTTTKGDWRGVYGDCFVLLPDACCTGFPQPEFGSKLDGVCTTEFDDLVSSFDLFRGEPDERPLNTFWLTENKCFEADGTPVPESSPFGLCGTVEEQRIPGFDSCGVDFSPSPGSAQWNPCAGEFKGSTWDEGDCITPGGVIPPSVSEITINFSGSTELCYYFVGADGSNRDQLWELFIDGVSEKSGDIMVTGNGKYLCFDLDDVEPGTVIRFETNNKNKTECDTGGPPNNSHLSGVFLSDCKVKQPCIDIKKRVSVDGDFEDADECKYAPGVDRPEDALYEICVTNCGNETLDPVIVNDPALGIEDKDLGALHPGEERCFEDRSFDFPCGDDDDADTSINKATVVGFFDDDDDDASSTVMDMDTACVLCDDDS